MEKELQEFRQERSYFAQSRLEELDTADIDRSEPVGPGQPERIYHPSSVGLSSRAQSTPDISSAVTNGIKNHVDESITSTTTTTTIHYNNSNSNNSNGQLQIDQNIDTKNALKKLDDATDLPKRPSNNNNNMINDNNNNSSVLSQTLTRSTTSSRRTRVSASPTRIQADRLINQVSRLYFDCYVVSFPFHHTFSFILKQMNYVLINCAVRHTFFLMKPHYTTLLSQLQQIVKWLSVVIFPPIQEVSLGLPTKFRHGYKRLIFCLPTCVIFETHEGMYALYSTLTGSVLLNGC
ncbi:unnamed protein product [Trichobilharzia regenti]|nr:unnamed protein product [Trichobilharzia regenti]